MDQTSSASNSSAEAGLPSVDTATRERVLNDLRQQVQLLRTLPQALRDLDESARRCSFGVWVLAGSIALMCVSICVLSWRGETSLHVLLATFQTWDKTEAEALTATSSKRIQELGATLSRLEKTAASLDAVLKDQSRLLIFHSDGRIYGPTQSAVLVQGADGRLYLPVELVKKSK